MFISGGEARGRKIKAPSAKDIRPTSLLIKEAFFEIFREKIAGCYFLDLFAGFGTMGIEAISRGAETVFFVDKSKYAISIIYENLKSSKLTQKTKVLFSDSQAALAKRIKEKFDLIYIDPPYDYKEYEKVLELISEKNILSENGIAVVEHYHKTSISGSFKNFEQYRKEKYGQTALTFFKGVNS